MSVRTTASLPGRAWPLLRRRLRWLVRPPAVREPVPRTAPGALRLGAAEEEAAAEAAREVVRGKRLYMYSPSPLAPSRVRRLEQAFARRMAIDHAVAVNSGTSALVTALAALGVGPGDEVIVPAYTWFSTASAVLAVGALPVVAEIDETLTLDPEDAAGRISPHTRAVLPVHMRGAAADLERLQALAREHRLLLLEDAAQATGGSYRGRPLGSIGDAGVHSFQQAKLLTSGEGGMVVTGNAETHRRAAMYHDAASPAHFGYAIDDWLPGLNLRMTELQAAVLLVQLERLDGLIADLRERKARLTELVHDRLAARGVRFRPSNDPEGETGIALIFFLPEARRTERVVSRLLDEGVPAARMYQQLARLPYDGTDLHVYTSWAPLLARRGWSAAGAPWTSHPRPVELDPDSCPRTLDLLGRAVHVDIGPDLTPEQVAQIASVIVDAAG